MRIKIVTKNFTTTFHHRWKKMNCSPKWTLEKQINLLRKPRSTKLLYQASRSPSSQLLNKIAPRKIEFWKQNFKTISGKLSEAPVAFTKSSKVLLLLRRKKKTKYSVNLTVTASQRRACLVMYRWLILWENSLAKMWKSLELLKIRLPSLKVKKCSTKTTRAVEIESKVICQNISEKLSW